ncbi:unnamed protein product [marine sediment metagenome]|uniref:Uncharacterized protein n=1 Tax=marine sediment metagenome TaxID=412755 RepID=X1HM26_9ZZZZ
MKLLTEVNVLKFMAEVQPNQELKVGRKVADLYDWLGGRSRIPSYYKMKATDDHAEKDRLIDYIYNRLFGPYKKHYIHWVRNT